MTVTIDLSEELVNRLESQASARGMSLPNYALQILRDAATEPFVEEMGIDINDPEQVERILNDESAQARVRVQEAVKSLHSRGLADENGNPTVKELPADMREGSDTDFGG